MYLLNYHLYRLRMSEANDQWALTIVDAGQNERRGKNRIKIQT